MAAEMDVDEEAKAVVLFHPVSQYTDSFVDANLMSVKKLAIVNMSDQFTRISKGGTPLPPTDPVVGLLFGTIDGYSTEVCDAVDAALTSTQVVDLHKAVYANHQVVGWYRVVSVGKDPTPEDLIQSQKLSKEYSESTILFLLLQIQEEPMFSLFSLKDDVLVHVPDSMHTLQTAPAERIAVERVWSEQPSTVNPLRASTIALQEALRSLSDRIRVLQDYISKTPNPDPTLLRQIQGFVLRAGLLKFDNWDSDGDSVATLSSLAGAIHMAKQFTDKIKPLHESNLSLSPLRQRTHL